MGGILPLNYDVAKAKAELDKLIAIDSASYHITGQQMINRTLRSGVLRGKLTCLAAGKGKTMIDTTPFSFEKDKHMETTDMNKAEIDYIGELIVDTRNYDPDEENMGIVVMDSSVISLVGGVMLELRFKERLNSIDVPILLGIDKLDECEVDIGIFRYVFGFNDWNTIVDNFICEKPMDSYPPQLISKNKYAFADEEFLDKEYAADCDEG